MRAKAVLCSVAVAALSLLAVWAAAGDPALLAPRQSSRMQRASTIGRSSQLHPPASLGSQADAPVPDLALIDPAQAAAAGGAVSLYLSSNQFDFHMTGPEAPEPLTVSGQVAGNHPAYRLGLKLPPTEDQFDLERIAGPDLAQAAAPIPTAWQLRYRGGGEWTGWLEPETEGGPGLSQRSFWWVLDDGSCAYEFELRCAIQPKPFPFQPAGHYERCIQIKALPWGE